MTEGLVDLSTEPMVNPCRRHGNATTCSWPVRHLLRGGIVVMWQLYGGMPALHAPPAGVRVDRIRDSFCRAIGGAETLRGRVVTAGHHIYYAYGCIARAGRAANAAAFRAMVRSARPG